MTGNPRNLEKRDATGEIAKEALSLSAGIIALGILSLVTSSSEVLTSGSSDDQ
jgi:hypothetical protein